MKLYLAGPLFTAAERQFNDILAVYLRSQGHQVVLPQESDPHGKIARDLFSENVHGIERCECVLACVDGADPDSGTSWEIGYAYAKGKRIVLYRTDFRSADDGFAPYNLMLTESATVLIDLRNRDSLTHTFETIGAALR